MEEFNGWAHLYTLSKCRFTLHQKIFDNIRWGIWIMKKQSIRRGVWYIGGLRQQRGWAFPMAALTRPILGGLYRPIQKRLIGRWRLWRWRQRWYA